MNRTKSLIKNTIIIGFGTFLPKFMVLITLPILTGKLISKDYGVYDLIETLISLLLPVVTLQISAAGFRFIIAKKDDEKECSIIITNIVYVMLLSSIISSIILYFIFYKIELKLRLLIILYFLIDIYNNSISQIVRGFSKNKIYSLATIIASIVKTIGICLLLSTINLGLYGVIISLLIAVLISFIYQFVKLKFWKYINISYISKESIKEMLSYSWPMIPNSLSVWVLNASDRFVITFFLGLEKNAIYAVANKIPTLISTLNSTFTMAWQENASSYSNDNDIDEYYSKMFDAFIRFIAGGCAVIISLTPILFLILIKGNYEEAYVQMPILFISIFYSCISSYLGGIYVASKKTKSVGVTTIVAAIINLLIDLLFIKLIGITAGSVSTMISYIFLVYFRMFDVQKFHKIKYDYKNIFTINLVLIIMSIICFFNKIGANIINIIIGFIFAIMLNKNMLIVIIKKIKCLIKKEKFSEKC